MERSRNIQIISIGFILIFVLGSCAITEMGKLRTPQYERGKAAYKGAESCSDCHKEIYDQWKTSRHSMVTKDPWFHEMKEGVSLLYNTMMGGDFCYNCHGPQELNEGVSCEVCHGINDQEDIDILHEQKYTQGLVTMENGQICGKCHGMKHPMTGDVIVTTQLEWENSPASKDGLDCTDCHMAKHSNGLAFHGFSSRYVDASIYEDDIVVKNVSFQFPNLSFVIENKITGHSFPTGGPEAVLLLEVNLQNERGITIHTIRETFKQSGTHVFGMPWGVVSDNRLQAGEIKEIKFSLPENINKKITSVSISFRLFSVDFRYKGDVSKARWESEIFFEQTFPL